MSILNGKSHGARVILYGWLERDVKSWTSSHFPRFGTSETMIEGFPRHKKEGRQKETYDARSGSQMYISTWRITGKGCTRKQITKDKEWDPLFSASALEREKWYFLTPRRKTIFRSSRVLIRFRDSWKLGIFPRISWV